MNDISNQSLFAGQNQLGIDWSFPPKASERLQLNSVALTLLVRYNNHEF